MTSYEKVVKLACKPKAAPPKAKYIDPIIAATWSEDGAVHDVCKALSPRFREPNAIVVFKALIVLHTMIRNGATDNVLSYLSANEVLRLGNVSAGTWEGYAAPENLQNYAVYLESRIRAYSDLKHDAIRVQAETNRDMRNNLSIDEDRHQRGRSSNKTPAPAAPSRSKTIVGRKLRVMTVEKGLLRETKAVHRMIDTLVECRFYLDDLEDELTTTALRMLVKDLLILFQAGNEGVINVLEHYFEMSHVDAEEALRIYRNFCKQTERVVEYLGVAKKLQNLLNVSIPNLKHAPVSLAGALQEYLNDPNFEQNRIEYKTNKDAAEKGSKGGSAIKSIVRSTTAPPQPPLPVQPSTSAPPILKNGKPEVIDFFSAIEETQPTMFNPQTNSPNSAYFQQQSMSNPFQQMQMTGQPFAQPQLMGQSTGFVPNPFGVQPQMLQPQATGHRPFSSFIPNQATGFPQQQSPPMPAAGFLQAQATGANPFRQSVLIPQTTGMAMFGVGGGSANGPGNAQFQGDGSAYNSQQQVTSAPSTATAFNNPMPSFGQQQQQLSFSVPPRPASTPLTGFGSSASSPPMAQPVKSHQTGTKNPFGPIMTPASPAPKPHTLMELAMGYGSANGNMSSQATSAPQGQSSGNFGGSLNGMQLQQTGMLQMGQSSGNFGGSGMQSSPMGQSSGNFSSNIQSQQTGMPQMGQSSGNFGASSNAMQSPPMGQSSGNFGSNMQSQQTGAPQMGQSSGNFGGSSNGMQSPPMGQTSGTFGGSPNLGSSAFNSFAFDKGALAAGSTDISSVASSFAFSNNNTTTGTSPSIIDSQKSHIPSFSSTFSTPLSSQNTATTTTGSAFSDSIFSSLSSQATGATNSSSIASSAGGLKPQMTGFSGLKPFKPTSSFGASLLESLPSIPGSAPTTPAVTGNMSPPFGQQTTSTFNPSSFGALNSNPGSTLGQRLRPQMTGGGAANPFRASMATGGTPNFGAFPASFGQNTTSPPPGGNMFGSNFGTNQPNGTASLI
ncbi:ANTH-domain-containing protein [Mycena floridula]|nr:ANTH-domain-containing protein [Mycena floridula]